jgi:D-alanyl-D-alanine carboxypeptidase
MVSSSGTQSNTATEIVSSETIFWSWINLVSDDSYQKFVSPDVVFEKLDYVPIDLVSLANIESLESGESALIRSEARNSLIQLSKDFYATFGKKIRILSAYRSFDYQKWIEINSPQCVESWFCAKSWHSEHQTWLAIDIFETTNEEAFLGNPEYKTYFDWFSTHAHEYWFTNSYRKWFTVDGYHEEPWHWRFVGIDLAKKLFEDNITFTEYYKTYIDKVSK